MTCQVKNVGEGQIDGGLATWRHDARAQRGRNLLMAKSLMENTRKYLSRNEGAKLSFSHGVLHAVHVSLLRDGNISAANGRRIARQEQLGEFLLLNPTAGKHGPQRTLREFAGKPPPAEKRCGNIAFLRQGWQPNRLRQSPVVSDHYRTVVFSSIKVQPRMLTLETVLSPQPDVGHSLCSRRSLAH
jgi:hypothetical protein